MKYDGVIVLWTSFHPDLIYYCVEYIVIITRDEGQNDINPNWKILCLHMHLLCALLSSVGQSIDSHHNVSAAFPQNPTVFPLL